MGNGNVIGPFFFRHNLNGEQYLQMINEQVVPALRRMRHYGPNRNGQLSVLVGARRRSSSQKTNCFRAFDRIVWRTNCCAEPSRKWPPHSPDLTPLDFFLWGYLKAKVYVTPPANLDDLEMRIRDEMDILKQNREMVHRSVSAMIGKAEICLERHGGHVED